MAGALGAILLSMVLTLGIVYAIFGELHAGMKGWIAVVLMVVALPVIWLVAHLGDRRKERRRQAGLR